MKRQDALFQLIKSLTRGEKRNFHILAQLTSGDKKYLQLFDVIEVMEEYDEPKILKKFKRDPKFEKQLAYHKNYLYNSILNSLAYFHKGNEAEMSSIALHVRVLLEKNLFFQAKKLLNKAKESAMEQEKFEELLKLLYMEVEILKVTENIKVLPEALRENEFSVKVTVDKISNLMSYRLLENQTYLLLATRHIARREDEQSAAEKLLAAPILQEESSALSNRARIYFHDIRRGLAYYKGDHENAMLSSARALAIFEAAPAILEESKLLYMKQYALYAHHVIWVHGHEKALPLIAKLRDVKVSTPQERVSRFEKYYLYSMGLIVGVGEKASQEFLQEFAIELEALENDLAIGNRLLASYIQADYFVVQGEYSKALFWTNKFLNHPRTNLRTDLQAGMRLINLLIHYELGNFDLIEYHLKSAYRYIYKQERMHHYERRFLGFFKDTLAATDAPTQREIMFQFREDILEIMKDPFEERASQVFNVVAWLDAKLEGIPMSLTKQREAAKHFPLKIAVPVKAEGPNVRPPHAEA
jgi:hypothetical protein